MHNTVGSKVNKEIHNEGGNKENRRNETRSSWLLLRFGSILSVLVVRAMPCLRFTVSIIHSFILSTDSLFLLSVWIVRRHTLIPACNIWRKYRSSWTVDNIYGFAIISLMVGSVYGLFLFSLYLAPVID